MTLAIGPTIAGDDVDPPPPRGLLVLSGPPSTAAWGPPSTTRRPWRLRAIVGLQFVDEGCSHRL